MFTNGAEIIKFTQPSVSTSSIVILQFIILIEKKKLRMKKKNIHRSII